MARLYRHAPLNAIWEGSGNVIALDVLRAKKHLPIFMQEVKLCSGIDRTLDSYIRETEKQLHYASSLPADALQRSARGLVDRLAISFQASLMLRYGCPKV